MEKEEAAWDRRQATASFWRAEGLSTRAANALARAKISSWEALREKTFRELLSRPGLGRVSAKEIRNAAARRGIALKREGT